MSARLKETSDKVYIEGIPPMRYGEHMDNSFIRSVQLCLNALGEHYSYEYLMGISGAAYRLHFDPKWCPSSTDATCGFDVSIVIFKYLGYSAEFKRINHNSFSEIKGLYALIRKQIDQGKPIVAINLMGNMDWGIVAGYLKNEPGIVCRTYYDESSEYSIASRAPWLNFFIGEKKNGLSKEELYKNSLKVAVQLAEAQKFDEYYSGFLAYEKWISRLNKINDSYSPEDIAQILEIHFIIFNALLDARRATVKYLSALKPDLRSKNMDRVIKHYEDIIKILENTSNTPGNETRLDQASIIKAIFKKQSEALSEALLKERMAIELLKEEINSW
jgi:hypothetical protein